MLVELFGAELSSVWLPGWRRLMEEGTMPLRVRPFRATLQKVGPGSQAASEKYPVTTDILYESLEPVASTSKLHDHQALA